MIIYSCPQPLNSHGPSRPLTKIHQALKEKYPDEYMSWSALDFPELTDPGRLGDAIGAAYDDVALEHIIDQLHRQPHESIDLFLGGGGASLHQLDLADRAGTLWFSSHWAHANKILTEEYANFGIPVTPIHPFVTWRAHKEQLKSDFIIVPSNYCKTTYPRELQDKTHVAEFGVDLDYYQPNTRGLTDEIRILFPATNPYRKGLAYLWQALPNLPDKGFKITATGGIKAKGLTQIETPGWVDETTMHDYYGNHDVLLLPSLEEGQALASLEAMASAMPIIVTPNVGIPITDGKEGFIIPPRDGDAIKDKIQYFLDNPKEIHRMGWEARKFAEKRPWAYFQNRVLDILEEVSNA